jgi:hypothetical protein
MEVLGEVLGLVIMGKDEETLTIRIIHLILIIVGFGGYAWLMHSVFPTDLLFRPNSMPTLFWSSQISLYEVSAMTTFFIALGCNLPQAPRNACVFIGGCLFALNFFQTKSKGGFLDPRIQRFYETINYILIGACLTHIILDLNQIQVDETYFIILGIVGLFTYILAGFFAKLKQIKQGILLDSIEESKDNFELIKTSHQFYSILLFGFKNSHPCCISWTLNRLAIDKWPKDEQICISFAKFISIYPEESTNFHYIFSIISINGFKSLASKHLLIEIIALV